MPELSAYRSVEALRPFHNPVEYLFPRAQRFPVGVGLSHLPLGKLTQRRTAPLRRDGLFTARVTAGRAHDVAEVRAVGIAREPVALCLALAQEAGGTQASGHPANTAGQQPEPPR